MNLNVDQYLQIGNDIWQLIVDKLCLQDQVKLITSCKHFYKNLKIYKFSTDWYPDKYAAKITSLNLLQPMFNKLNTLDTTHTDIKYMDFLNIKSLCIGNKYVDYNDIKKLKLEKLVINNKTITDIPMLTSLTKLTVTEHTNVIHSIASLTNLIELAIHVDTGMACFKIFAKLTKITSLSIKHCAANLENLKLQNLILDNSKVSGLSEITTLTNLVMYENVTYDDIPKSVKHLEYEYDFNNYMRDELESLTNLESLTTDCELINEQLVTLTKLTLLECGSMVDVYRLVFTGLPNLKKLTLNNEKDFNFTANEGLAAKINGLTVDELYQKRQHLPDTLSDKSDDANVLADWELSDSDQSIIDEFKPNSLDDVDELDD